MRQSHTELVLLIGELTSKVGSCWSLGMTQGCSITLLIDPRLFCHLSYQRQPIVYYLAHVLLRGWAALWRGQARGHAGGGDAGFTAATDAYTSTLSRANADPIRV